MQYIAFIYRENNNFALEAGIARIGTLALFENQIMFKIMLWKINK